MIFHYEPIGRYFIFIQGTTRELVGVFACAAIEMMMMALSCPFIHSPERWVGDPFQPPVIDEKLEVPIDSCLIERCHEPMSVSKNLIHPQRPVVLSKDLFNGHSLCRVSPQSLNLHFY